MSTEAAGWRQQLDLSHEDDQLESCSTADCSTALLQTALLQTALLQTALLQTAALTHIQNVDLFSNCTFKLSRIHIFEVKSGGSEEWRQ